MIFDTIPEITKLYLPVIYNKSYMTYFDRKLAKGDYKNLSQLKSDFTLMMNNCSTFNRHNEFFWKYGHRLHRIGLKYFRAAEKDVQALTLVGIFQFNFLYQVIL